MQSPLNIGVDVGKCELVVACETNSFTPHTIANRRAALCTWLKSLPQGSRIGVESTSIYHQLLADLAFERGFTVFVLNPRDVRHYAKGVGARGKTDRLDAQVIARYLAREHSELHPYQPPTPDQRRIDELLRRRAKLTTIRATLQQSLRTLPACRDEAKALFGNFDVLIKRMDSMLARLNALCAERLETQRRLQTIVGIGPICGISLSNLFHRVPLRNADAAVAFVGYDTRADDSGERRGRRRVSKRGPSELRRLLFNAAMAASKSKTWNPIYRHYRDTGLSSTAVLCIIARKILRTAWSIYAHNTTFDPHRLTRQT